MKNLTIRRMTERGEQLFRAIAVRCYPHHAKDSTILREPEIQRYLRYVRYRNNLKRLGIG